MTQAGNRPTHPAHHSDTLLVQTQATHIFVFSANSSNPVLSCDAHGQKGPGLCTQRATTHSCCCTCCTPLQACQLCRVCVRVWVSEPDSTHGSAARTCWVLTKGKPKPATRSQQPGTAHQQPSTAAAQRQQQGTAAGGLLRCRNTCCCAGGTRQEPGRLCCMPARAGRHSRPEEKKKRSNRNSSSSSWVLHVYLLAIWAAIRSAASCTVLIFSAPAAGTHMCSVQRQARRMCISITHPSTAVCANRCSALAEPGAPPADAYGLPAPLDTVRLVYGLVGVGWLRQTVLTNDQPTTERTQQRVPAGPSTLTLLVQGDLKLLLQSHHDLDLWGEQGGQAGTGQTGREKSGR